MANVISGADYLAIAQYYATARSRMVDTVQYFWNAVYRVVLLDDIQPSIDLLGEYYASYLLNEGKMLQTSGFDAAVRAMQQHVARSHASGTVDGYLAAEVPSGVPQEWADLSAAAGFSISADNIA